MTVKVTNNAWGVLRTAINATDVRLLVETGEGDRFPAVVDGSNNIFYATIINPDNELEIVKVTDRDSDTFTIERAQGGTTAKAFLAGARVEVRPVAELFDSKVDIDEFNDALALCVKVGDIVETDEPEEYTDEEKETARDSIDAMSTTTDQTVTGSKTWEAEQIFNGGVTFNCDLSFGNIKLDQDPDSEEGDSYSISATMATNDGWRIIGLASESDAGELEIATRDNGNEPIYVRQYSGTYATLKNEACLLDKNGNTQFPGELTAVSFTASSDRRMKRDFVKLADPLGVVRGITGYHFRRLDKNGKFVGVIAQDVQKVLPDAVKVDTNGYYTVDYNALVAVLIEANKKLESRVRKLESFINKGLKKG